MPDFETADDIAMLAAQHDTYTTIATPMYSDLHIDHHNDFMVAARAARSETPVNPNTGERTSNLDFDLATAISPRFNRLSTAITQAATAASNRRFNP